MNETAALDVVLICAGSTITLHDGIAALLLWII